MCQQIQLNTPYFSFFRKIYRFSVRLMSSFHCLLTCLDVELSLIARDFHWIFWLVYLFKCFFSWSDIKLSRWKQFISGLICLSYHLIANIVVKLFLMVGYHKWTCLLVLSSCFPWFKAVLCKGKSMMKIIVCSLFSPACQAVPDGWKSLVDLVPCSTVSFLAWVSSFPCWLGTL